MKKKPLIQWVLKYPGRLAITLTILLAANGLVAQQGKMILDTAAYLSNTQTLSLVTKHYGDSIVLRWAPVKAEYWYDQLHKSCIIARREVSPNPGEYQVISDSIRLMPEGLLEQFASAHTDHPLLVVLLNNAYREWENSLYDGDISTMIEKSSNFNNRWSLTLFAADRDPVVADAAGMRFVDRTIKKNVTYAYKVFIPGNYSASDSKVAHPNLRKFTPLIYQGFERDSSLVIQWQKHMHDAHFSAYYIERSEDGKTFKRLNELPYVQAFSNDPQFQTAFYTYTDRVANGKKYQYRLIGLDAFGDESKPSQLIELKAHDLEPPLKPLVEVKVDSLKKGVYISWTHEHPDDVKNYLVSYSEGGEQSKVISPLLAADARSFFHQPEDFNGMSKYTVACADHYGNSSVSDEHLIRVPDFSPPSRPMHLEALTDSTGLIRVRWDSAVEKDIIGYFVYAADGDRRHFHRLTPKIYPFRQFTDTVDIHSLTEMRYYTVVAVDDALQYSAYSDTLEVERPDVMPPSPAWIQSYTITDSTVILQLVASSSRDVVMHLLRRKTEEDSLWKVLDTLASDVSTYVDTSAVFGKMNIYSLTAYDEQGLASKIISEKHILLPISRNPETMEWLLEKDTTGMQVIRWVKTGEASGVQIYTKPKSQWQYMGEAKAEELMFRLNAYQGEPVMAKVIYADGSKSKSFIITENPQGHE